MKRKDIIIRSEEASYFLASIVDSSKDSIVTIDFNGIITSWNKAAELLYGYQAQEAIGQPLTMVTLPDDLKQLLTNIDRIKNSKAVRTYDTIRHRKDGELINLEIVLSPVKNAADEVIGVSTIARDIIGRKQTEEALRKSEERLRVTMEAAIDFAIITLDTERNITDWNNGAELMLGYSKKEAIGQTADIIFTPEDRAAGAPQHEQLQALKEGRAIDERWHLRKDGSRFYMSGVMTPMYNDGLKGFVKIARDRTERKTAEEALSMSEERYRIAMTSANMGAWDWDIETNQILWNEQHYQLLGLKPDMLPQDIASFEKFVHPDDREQVMKAVQIAIEQGDIYHSEFRIIRQDGAIRWMKGYGRSVGIENGKATRMVGVMYDITERKELERQKDEFIGIASHELKTPVTSIKSYTETLHDILKDRGDDTSAGLVTRLDKQVERLTHLVNDLLDVTKITEGQVQLNRQNFDINNLIGEITEDLLSTTEKHQITTELHQAIEVYADRERITQVLTNLISNALKYSPNEDKIIISSKVSDTEVTICVQDFGIGISPHMQEKIFERFFRSRDKNVDTFPGLGLGLFIARDIVIRHGGRIWVESEEGKGSVFCFTIPFKS